MNIKYKCKSNIERITLALELQKLGWDLSDIYWDDIYEDDSFKEAPYINIDNETNNSGSVFFIEENYETGNDIPEIKVVKNKKNILVKYESFKEIRIKLNNSYEAIVKSDHIKVGCQTFTFDKIKELYDAIEEYKKK